MPDGRRLLRHDRYDFIQAKARTRTNDTSNEAIGSDLLGNNVLRIHPSFRIVALGVPPDRENLWITAEALSIFPFIETLPNLSVAEKIDIVSGVCPPSSAESQSLLESLRRVTEKLSALDEDPGSEVKLSASLAQSSLSPSCRQLLRLWAGSNEHLTSLVTSTSLTPQALLSECSKDMMMRVRKMFMAPFMPHALREAFDAALTEATLSAERTESESVQNDANFTSSKTAVNSRIEVDCGNGVVRIGSATLSLNKPSRPELVPDTLFVDVPAHVSYLEEIAHDVLAGDRHVLLIGNQGVSSLSLLFTY